MNSIESLQNRGKGAAVTRKHGYKINTASIGAQHAAEEMMLHSNNIHLELLRNSVVSYINCQYIGIYSRNNGC